MLHISPRSGQARCANSWSCAIAALVFVLATVNVAHAQSPGPPTLAQAAAFARDGQHLEAAARYEQLARRGFMSWDANTALLAAREYILGGSLADAERLVNKVRNRVRSDDVEERALLLEVEARLALERGDAIRAMVALRALPQPLPPAAASELLSLRGRAEIAAGDALSGVRTFAERSALVQTPAARSDNDKLLLDALLARPPGPELPAGISEVERGWLELPALLMAAGSANANDASATATQWLLRHPGHPGAVFIPNTAEVARALDVGAIDGPNSIIALLLPLTGKQQAAGSAVRDGFTAAWFASSSADTRPRIMLHDTAGPGAAAAYQRAIAAGARMVVGPLTKEEITAVVASQPAGLPVPTLALNAISGQGMTPPAFLFQFALDPEQEARAVARRIADDGLVHGIALFPDNAWGQRLHDAFVQEAQATGSVTVTATEFYSAGAKDFSGPLRAALGRYGGAGDRSSNPNRPRVARNSAAEQASGPQFAFVAATPQAARAIRPQLRFQMTYDLPLYTTSDAWDPSVRAAADMDGMVFPEMPWLLFGGQGAPELWDAVQEDWSARARGRLRLYAFGYDAFRLAQQFGSAGAVAAGVDGLTGLLELNLSDGRVQRSLQFARIEGGKAQAAGTSVPTFRDVPATNSTGAPPPN